MKYDSKRLLDLVISAQDCLDNILGDSDPDPDELCAYMVYIFQRLLDMREILERTK